MGGSSSDSGGSNNVARSNPNEMRAREMAAATNRAKEQQEAKSRQVAFDQGGTRGRESPEYKMNSGSGRYKEVDQNVRIARDLEQKAKSSQINIPIPTVGSVAMNTISSINYNNQAKQLRSGGRAVFDNSNSMFDPMKDYKGVVNKGTYSGDPDFSPIGRSDSTRTSLGSYSISAKQSDNGNDSSPPATSPPKDVTEPIKKKTPTLSTASRRAMLSGSGGGASRRNLL